MKTRHFLLLTTFSLVGFLGITFSPKVSAEDFTLPLITSPAINSWFDHNTSSNALQIWDGSSWTSPPTTLTSGGCSMPSCYDGHNGVDYQASTGTDVYTVSGGTIQQAQFDNVGGLGNFIRVWHASLGYSSVYAHLDSFVVSSGSVRKGLHIAESGCSGSCGGPHLHLEVRNAQTGGTALDPHGWASTGSDPYTANIGYLWGTRIGVLDTSNNFKVKEPYMSTGFTDVASSASAFAIGESRIAYISSGSVFVKDPGLGGGWNEIWNSSSGSASKVLLAGRRIVVMLSNGTVYAKDGAWNDGWYGGTSIATSVSDVFTSKNWTAILFSNQELYIKAGLGDGWFDVAGGVTSAAISANRLVALFYEGSVYAKEGGFDSGYGWTQLDSGASAITAGGRRICDIRSGTAYCKESNLSDTWTTTYSGASLVRANDARVAVKDSSNGYLKVLEGAVNDSNSGWNTIVTSGGSDIGLN